jgi:hypothetical protein
MNDEVAMHSHRSCIPILAGALLVAATAVPAAAQDSWSWNRQLRPGQTLEIKGVNGSITASAAGSGEARVNAVRRARRSNPADVVFEVVEHAGGVTICAVYPTRPGRQPNECRPGPGGRSNVENNDVVVDFNVRVPNGIDFVGRTINGGIEATGLPADAAVSTVNGSIRLVTAGLARAGTVNGNVDVSMGRSDWTGDLRLETTNGSVTLRVPGTLNAEVSASTVTGGIETDFPLEVRGRIGQRRLTGTVGSGGRRLELVTVNGSIALKRQ